MEGIVIGALCVWRITHLLNAEDGPGQVFVRLRRLAGRGFWGDLLDCFYCLSLWVAAPVAWLVVPGWKARLLLWLALSGAASLLERATVKSGGFAGMVYEENRRIPMCCGRARQQISNEYPTRAAFAEAVARPRLTVAEPPARSMTGTGVIFEYGGRTALTLVSPLTGRTYRFARPGARVEIDARDRSWVASVPTLKRR